jgi:FkbM family methyltransferase
MEKYLNFTNGFFIEAGANDGVSQSNTTSLEQRGWTGLLVEPNYFKYQECVRNRPNCIVENYALVSSSYNKPTISGDFNHTDWGNSLMSMVIDKDRVEAQKYRTANHSIIEVPATTLTSLLLKHNIKKVDFLSLDVEGYEISVLNGLDFNIFKPTYVLLEASTHEDRRTALIDYMHNKFYSIEEYFGCNDILFKVQ